MKIDFSSQRGRTRAWGAQALSPLDLRRAEAWTSLGVSLPCPASCRTHGKD